MATDRNERVCSHPNGRPSGSDRYLLARAVGCHRCELVTVYDGHGEVLATFAGHTRARSAHNYLASLSPSPQG
jgi:hypothetical protein